ncbi:YcxB family protein [Hamadaea sp. NPDC050747]|uniref:YcxB family protein n=1 Tax=Hamadaea sp. NPDC050747 TaxID=3155789 RepID=UPI0033EEDDFC
MQIHAEDRVELTVMLDKADYRRVGADIERPRRWTNLLIAPIPLGAFVSLLAEQWISSLILTFVMLSLIAVGVAHRRLQAGKLPDWAFGATTFRATPEGFEVDQVVARRFVGWTGIAGYRKTPTAYWILVSGGTSFAVPRRPLTGQDEIALDAVLQRYTANHVYSGHTGR